jgi:phosphoribosylpyrophosphate synthetase
MKVRFICGYYSDLAHKNKQRRPEDYWDALNFCWAVKVGKFKPQFNIHDANSKKVPIRPNNFSVVRRTFGQWIEKSLTVLGAGEDIVLVPVPSKDGIVGAASFRSLDMTSEALKGTRLAARVNGGLRWKQKLTAAHEGGARSRALLAPLLVADDSFKGKTVILVDDLVTKGCSLLASSDVLAKAGAKVLGAVVCGKTIYDLDTPHFAEQEFDLTGELSDWTG